MVSYLGEVQNKETHFDNDKNNRMLESKMWFCWTYLIDELLSWVVQGKY